MGARGRERVAGRRPPRPGKSVWSGSRSGRGRVGLAATSGQARGQEGSEPGTSGALPLCGHEGGSRGLQGVPPAWPGSQELLEGWVLPRGLQWSLASEGPSEAPWAAGGRVATFFC